MTKPYLTVHAATTALHEIRMVKGMDDRNKRIERLEDEASDLRQALVLLSQLLDDYRAENQVLQDRVSDLEINFRQAVRILAEQTGVPGIDLGQPKGTVNFTAMKNP